jgi:hypothetical protein
MQSGKYWWKTSPIAILTVLVFFVLLSGTENVWGETSLFNGRDLDGWSVIGDARWSVMDETITASNSGDGAIATQNNYRDFRLTLEFWVDSTVNSGVFIRCKVRDKIDPENCFEFNIWDEHPKQEARTGAVVIRFMPPLVHVDSIGKWNTYEIVADGGKLTGIVNGQITAELGNADPAAGVIALQHFGTGTVRFRNIRIENLNPD